MKMVNEQPSSRIEPLTKVRQWCLQQDLPSEIVESIPSSYIRFGPTIILRFPPGIPTSYERVIGEGWVRSLEVKTALKRSGIITGTFREPIMERLYGPGGDVTHVENGILYTFDPEKIMFSPGNQNERIRMASIDMSGETVVDMFAGIGYFSLPTALYSGARTVYSCEINPVSFDYLTKNITDNKATVLVPLLGNNRMVAPEGVADRIIMGYVGTTHLYLEKALRCLRDEGGIIHYHETCPLNHYPDSTERRIMNAARSGEWDVTIQRMERVKTYGPKMLHVVADVHVTPGK